MSTPDTLRAVDYRDLLAQSANVGIAIRVAQRNGSGVEMAAARAAELVNKLADLGYELRHTGRRWTA